MAEGTPRSQCEQQEKQQLSCLAYVLYYVVLFFAFWFGPGRFDMDRDGDFDPTDVQEYLETRGYLSKRFHRASRAKRPPSPSAGSAPRSPSAGDAPRSPPAASTPRGNGAERAAGPASNGQQRGAFSWLDRDGDGEVEFEDIMGDTVDGTAVETEVVENLVQKHRLPWFIIFEGLSIVGFWLVVASIKASNGDSDAFSVKAGLEFVADGMTDLRLYGPQCEDYRPQVWRWLTYQWTHVGAMHVMMNLFLLVMLGVPLEGLHGSLRLLIMFNAGVVGGAFCYFIVDAHTAVVGCSGGCYALVGIHLAALIMNWRQTKFRWPTLAFLFLLVSVDVTSYFLAVSSESASHSAHVGGGLAGLLVGIVVCRNTRKESHEKYIWCFSLTSAIALSLASIVCMLALCNNGAMTVLAAAAGERGWCWRRQVWLLSDPFRHVRCIKCGTQACIQYYSNLNSTVGPIVGSNATVTEAHCRELQGLSPFTQELY